MIYLYSIYFHTIKILCLFFFSFILFSSFPLVVWNSPIRRKWVLSIGRYWAKTILFLSFLKISVSFEAPLDPNKNYVFLGNHQSSLDIYLYNAYIPVFFNWIAKKSLFYLPLLGWAMMLQEHIPVEREDSQKSLIALKKALEKIKKGISIAIFPEGTRSPDGKLLPFKKGAFFMARQTGNPIVPILIKNACFVIPKGKWLVNRKYEIKMHIYQPINSREKNIEEKIRNLLEKGLEENK